MSDSLKIFQEDPEYYQEKFLAKWLEKTGEGLDRTDSRKLLLDTMAYGFSLLGTSLNYKLRQNFVRYSSDEDLEALGEYKDVERQDEQYAVTTVQIEITKALDSDYAIPAQLATSGNGIYFQTEYAIISAGETSIELTATCTTAGETGNGYLPGELTKLVDPPAYFKSVTNTTTSQGGSEVEEDDSYREEIINSPEGYSTAGPKEAYKVLVKSINQEIIDVAVYSPEPCYINIAFLMNGGEIPTETILEEVSEGLSADTKRPLGDLVTVEAPEEVAYDVELTYYISESYESASEDISTAVYSAVEEFELWQKSALGRDINPSKLYFLMKDAGVKRIEVTSPVFQSLTETQLAVMGAKTITFGGTEDD